MSFLAIEWASEAAPAADTYERIILMKLASHAGDDGCGAYPSIPSMARACLCDTETVKRRLRSLQKRRVIGLGDQRLVHHYPANRRPKVYDLLIPAEWYSNDQLAKVNRQRVEVGLEPLTPENRPSLALPLPKRTRADKGIPNPKRNPKRAAPSLGALSEPPTNEGNRSLGGSLRAPSEGSLSRPLGALSEPQTSQAVIRQNKTSQAGNDEPASDGTATACLPAEPPQQKTPQRGSSAPDTPGARLLRSLNLGTPVTAQVIRQHHQVVTELLETWPEDALRAHLEREISSGRVRNPMGVLVSVIRGTEPYRRSSASLGAAQSAEQAAQQVDRLARRGREGAREVCRLLGLRDWVEPERGDQDARTYLLHTVPTAAREFVEAHRAELIAKLTRTPSSVA